MIIIGHRAVTKRKCVNRDIHERDGCEWTIGWDPIDYRFIYDRIDPGAAEREAGNLMVFQRLDNTHLGDET